MRAEVTRPVHVVVEPCKLCRQSQAFTLFGLPVHLCERVDEYEVQELSCPCGCNTAARVVPASTRVETPDPA